MKCLNCSKETTNPKFCSRSCSASYTNKANPRIKPVKNFCKKCGVEIKRRRSPTDKTWLVVTVCDECNPNIVDWSSITKGELTNLRSYQINSRIRELSRLFYKRSGKPQQCAVCEYSKHIEIHHIKSIESFDNDAPISEINATENLIALCPTHHWEYDNGEYDTTN